MIGFGGPTRADEIRPFLDNVLRGRPVSAQRYEQVVHHYEHLGGRSPYNELTMRQADALRAVLAREDPPIPVFVGMRNWEPYLADAIRELAACGVRRALGFIMAAYRSEASWERYQQNVCDAQQPAGAKVIEFDYPRPWHNHPLYIRAVAARVAEAIARLGADDLPRAQLIFTAHSIPVAMAAASPYVEQLTESSQLVAQALGLTSWTLAFQSRSGSPREPWLEPDIGDAIRKLGGRPAIVAPIGFLCDHVEVLYDLDVEAMQIAREAGVRMVRAPTVGDHPQFIEMMAAVIREQTS
jgi:protoporphyrin/coproporphyrin ferrochelatase